MRDFRNIVAWQKADDLVMRVYELTESSPKSEMFGLTSQIRRAAVAVAANIGEGMAFLDEPTPGKTTGPLFMSLHGLKGRDHAFG